MVPGTVTLDEKKNPLDIKEKIYFPLNSARVRMTMHGYITERCLQCSSA